MGHLGLDQGCGWWNWLVTVALSTSLRPALLTLQITGSHPLSLIMAQELCE